MKTWKLVSVLVLVVVAAGVLWMWGDGGEGSPPPSKDAAAEGIQAVEGEPIRIASPEVSRGDERRPVAAPESLDGGGYRQGVSGTVVDPGGHPVQGARVFLMESSMSNAIQRFQAMQSGVVFPPIASAVTDPMGGFRLGLQEPVPGTLFEVRITSDLYADHKLPSLSIQDGDWYELPAVVLEQGAMVHGHVVTEGLGVPVPGAVVSITAAGGVLELSPTPGREQGLLVEVDQTGYFQVRNAPVGLVDIAAAAPGFARIVRRGESLDPMVPNEIGFELSRGLAIRGVVTDPAGVPVSGARVMASSLLPVQPQREETRTDMDGRFEFASLVEAPFQLTAVAAGFQRHDEKPVQAPSDDVRLVMERQSMAKVAVFGRNRLLQSYLLDVKGHFAAQDQIGNLQDQAPRSIRGSDLVNGFATVQNLNAGNYVFQIDAQGYARTFSEPFTVGPGMPTPSVEVHMSVGGSVTGLVTDGAGNPIPGVDVQTQVNGTVPNPIIDMLGHMIPKRITEISTRTDAQGRYRLDTLAKGAYQLKLTHPEYCDEVVTGIEVHEGQVAEIPTAELAVGAVITGRTMVDGAPAGQIRVSIQTDPGQGGVLNVEAVSDSEGLFTIPRRLPPGSYRIQATRPSEDPFTIFLDTEKSRRPFTVLPGQAQLQMDVYVPSRGP